MPVFYFDTEINGARLRDQEGVPLPDIDAAKHEAVNAAYCIAREIEPEISACKVALYVRDRSDRVVFETALNLTTTDR